ncbi:MAG: hybrid sensor histidine kinase/response regulator [Algicola sp.]|nr:hybrid sensor histidine kinase/response regulator [Algicola sp.]
MSNQISNEFAGKHILVVDDIPAISEFLVAILEYEGYKVSAVTSGEDALVFVDKTPPDLILLDIIMEGIDGFETCRRLKADELSQHIPVIFVTAKNDAEDVVEGFKLGAVDFVIKPLRKEDVCIRIGTQLKVQAFIQAQQAQIIQAEKLASLAELMGEFSHELETPIGIILTAQTHMEEKLHHFQKIMSDNRLTKSKLTAFVDVVEDANRLTLSNITRAIERTNSFKRLSVDQCSEERRRFNMLEFLHHIELALRSKFINTDHQIIIQCDEDIIIDSFPGALSQVVINLINNSLIHGFENQNVGVINIDVAQQGEVVSLVYSDDGKGISAEMLPKIFSQYYTSKPDEGGSGLGLYLVKSIVEKKLDGALYCTSEVGNGIILKINLPLGKV